MRTVLTEKSEQIKVAYEDTIGAGLLISVILLGIAVRTWAYAWESSNE
jgi:hypothetical protein